MTRPRSQARISCAYLAGGDPTEKDPDDLVNIGPVGGIDYISASLGRADQNLDNILKLLGPHGRGIKIISRSETWGTSPKSKPRRQHYGCPYRPGHRNPAQDRVHCSGNDDQQADSDRYARHVSMHG
ncbi:unnamed protein product [Phytophthora lilii]|uniref:Unnamed protein product n=1 Tax=Phytophthora lilii TaxID=2077276 RepID=A0A9W7CPX5_9STRA|nr:unnamed protein product [Phytophthora lilii]